MAVGAVLLAIMSYPLVNTLIRGEQAPVEAPVAAIEQPMVNEEMPVAAETPAMANVAPATEAADNDVEPLSSLQPQPEGQAAGQPETAATQVMPPETSASETVQPDAKLPEAAQSTPETGTVNSRMLSPTIEGTAPETATDEASTASAQPAAGEAALTVPADIKPEALAEAARKGDPLALFEVGAVYTEGRGIKADLAQAAKWYQRAADAGVIPAQYRLASLYEKGTGVSRDLVKRARSTSRRPKRAMPAPCTILPSCWQAAAVLHLTSPVPESGLLWPLIAASATASSTLPSSMPAATA